MTADPRSDRVRGRKRGIAVLLLAAVLAGGLIAGGQLLDLPALDDEVASATLGNATSGTAYCPVVVAQDEASQLEIASASTDTDSEITITTFVDGQPVVAEPRVLQAGRSALLDVPAEQRSSPVQIDWRGGPVVAQYRITDEVEQATAVCATQPSDRWYLSGFDTDRGNRSLLYLFNPFDQDAVVRLSFGTPEGPVDLVIAEEILVPAGRVEVRDLADFRPEAPDLAVQVTAEVGRVVPQGQLVRGPAGEGLEAITGRALIPAAPAVSEVLAFPEALADDTTESWVTLYNPSDRAAAVQVQVSTPLGTATELAAERTVPAGGTTRIDLAGLSALPRLGVQVSSLNGIGLAGTRTSAVRDGDRTGLAVSAAARTADTGWVVPGGRAADDLLALYNPGTAVAVAAVAVAGEAPAEWAAVEVPPNGVATLSLEGVDPEGAALVSADVPIVAGVVSLAPEAPSVAWSSTGVPLSALLGGGAVVPARRDPSLAARPALSATATPTPTPVPDSGQGEGQVDPDPTPTLVPIPTTTPTPSPGVTIPPTTDPTATPSTPATPTSPTTAAPDPASPAPTTGTTEEGLFG